MWLITPKRSVLRDKLGKRDKGDHNTNVLVHKPVRGAQGLPWLVWSGLDGVRNNSDERGRQCPLYTPQRGERGRWKRVCFLRRGSRKLNGCGWSIQKKLGYSEKATKDVDGLFSYPVDRGLWGQWPTLEPDGLERCHLVFRSYHVVWHRGVRGQASSLEMCPIWVWNRQ